MPHADAETAVVRADTVLAIQGEFLDAFAESLVGRSLPVLIEQYDEESACWIGRSYADSPEIDSMVYVYGSCTPGDMPTVLVESAENGILYGRIAESEGTPC
jgi:ribosomal protein S12 methylthiotransferase